jgi:cytochrome P450
MAVTFDPADEAVLRDPYPVFAAMRSAGGVHWSEPLAGWVAVDWASVQAVVTTPALFSANRMVQILDRLPEPRRTTAADVLDWLAKWMVFQDPPNHTRLRRHLASVINPRMVHTLRASTERIVLDVLDELPKDEPFDFYTRFGLTVPGYVVMDLLGVPRDRLAEVKLWADEMMLFIGSARGVADKYERARHGAHSMADLFRELIEQRRTAPRDDVLTRMIESTVDGQRLSSDELIASMMMIGNGAQETTAHLFSNGLLALAAHPQAARALAASPDSLVATAVEEFMRFDSPVLSAGRLVTEATELGGQRVRAGDRIFAMLAAANRDPAVFEAPDELRITGRPSAHLAFSKGVHFCLGAPVARLEAQIAFTELLTRFPQLRIAEPVESIPWVNSLVTRGPQRLPVTLG